MEPLREEIDDGGPAFPVVVEGGINSGLDEECHYGASLRDYFAAKALQGILASEDLETSTNNRPATARAAYEYADAMLSARKK